MLMLMRSEAALARGAEGVALELDLDALAATPIEIEQQKPDRAPLDRLDQRGDLGRIRASSIAPVSAASRWLAATNSRARSSLENPSTPAQCVPSSW